MNVLKAIYDSEINFAVETLWEGGRVKLGDALNGFTDEANFESWADLEAWLAQRVIARYPGSVAARMLVDGQTKDQANTALAQEQAGYRSVGADGMGARTYAGAVEPYATALRMIEDAIGELFGPAASLPDPDSVVFPKPEQRAEAIIAALQRVNDARR